jgi:glycosyltransferase involved in cell wall biosynthesis
MKILFIAPLPDPINGQSKASKMALDCIDTDDVVTIINLRKKKLKNGFSSFGRFFEIFKVLIQVWENRKYNDLIYISIAESFAGNLRDLFIYFICFKSRKKILIHMLGGAGMAKILKASGPISFLNRYIMARIGGVIVEGELNFLMFKNIISKKKIHIIPNFADDYLFVDDEEINRKFSDKKRIQILYLSNLIPGKGYIELANAYIELSQEYKDKIVINFVGGFESSESKHSFLSKIEQYEGLNYLGKFIDGSEKRALYCKSHVFCLPTFYPFEGQPISILEAYASGCVVITSNHSGIPFVFKDKINGLIVEKKSIVSLKKAIEETVLMESELVKIALKNRDEALNKYRTETYKKNILNVFQLFK